MMCPKQVLKYFSLSKNLHKNKYQELSKKESCIIIATNFYYLQAEYVYICN